MSQYEYKIIRYKHIQQDDEVVPNDLIPDKGINLTGEEFRKVYDSILQVVVLSPDPDAYRKLLEKLITLIE